MRTNSNTKRKPNGNEGAAVFRMIPLKDIAPSPTNTRQHCDEKGIESLAESIRQNGVWQPILVREIKPARANGAKYQIVFGERRWRASRQAGLKEIPARVKAMNDEEALGAQIVENLQREDVHPLDEADGFLRLREEMKFSVRDIAQRVAKDVRHVARRLAPTSLIEEAREDFRKERITLAHALEICRLAPEIQPDALAACYETKSVFNRKANTYEYEPDKTRPARHVRHLLDWLAQNVHLNLQKAPFKPDDARLREDGLTCLDCPQRSGFNKTLFADFKNAETCLNPICFQAKLRTFVQITKSEIETKTGKPAVFISTHYGAHDEDGDTISRGEYQIIERKADRCEYAESAVYADGSEIGRMKWICRDRSCKDHMGRVPDYRAASAPGGASPIAAEDRCKRKQELFDIRIDEAVRKRVMAEAIKTYSWPLDRQHLNEAVKEFFRRIPIEHQRTICEVLGWNNDEAGKLRFDDAATLAKVAALSDHELAQFLMLCSFAHYGANQYGNRQVDQNAVVRLSEERGINRRLIDATVRAELCPKKYRAAHQTYLNAVKEGRAADKPVVYERAPKAAQEATHTD